MKVALVAAAMLAASAAPSAGAASRRACLKRGEHSILRGRTALLFKRRTGSDTYYGACSSTARRRLFLAFDGLDVEGAADVVTQVKLAGDYAAVASGLVSDGGVHTDDISVFDLRTRRRVPKGGFGAEFGFRTEPLARHARGTNSARHETVSALVLAANGVAAWIGVDLDTRQGEVHTTGGLLDAAPGIDPHSLTLSGSTLSWTRSGTRRTASLH